MAALFVIVLSIAAGAATYVATVRGGRRLPAAVGFDTRSGGAAAVALGSEPVAEPVDGDQEPATEADAEIVDLDSARTPATPDDTATADASEADVLDASPEREVEDAEGTSTVPLAPVIVTAATVPAPEPGYAYLRVSTKRPSWRDRIAGVIGIAILVVLGSAAIAFGIYQLGSGINALVQRFLDG